MRFVCETFSALPCHQVRARLHRLSTRHRRSSGPHSTPSDLQTLFSSSSSNLVGLLQTLVPYVPEGLEGIIFSADGNMRQALNNLQATFSGFRVINQENVFKVYDQPHPLHVKNIIRNILEGKFDDAYRGLKQLYDLGYSLTDIKNYDMAEYLKLEFMKETGFAHMRICDGVGSYLQLSGSQIMDDRFG